MTLIGIYKIQQKWYKKKPVLTQWVFSYNCVIQTIWGLSYGMFEVEEILDFWYCSIYLFGFVENER